MFNACYGGITSNVLPELMRAGSLTLPRLVGQTSDPIGSRTFSGNIGRCS
jgi:hypothetical protein